jgi:hypothetical protein
MSFHFTRRVNDTHAQDLEAGGSFTMGFLDQTLFTGDVEFRNIVGGATYWQLGLQTVSVNDQTITLSTVDAAFAAIDTGTTLIGGPPSDVSKIYSKIPGARALGDTHQGYFAYPCATQVRVGLNFGGRTWFMSPDDFRLQQVTKGPGALCTGAFFALNTGANAPAWIIGDAFLKNVYSVFRFNPPSVGFAQLSTAAEELSRATLPLPSPSFDGSDGVQVTAALKTDSPRPTQRLSSASRMAPSSLMLISAAGVMLAVWLA